MSDEQTKQKIDDGGPMYPSGRATCDVTGNDYAPELGCSVRTWLAGQSDVPWNAVIETLRINSPDHKERFDITEVLEYRAELKLMEADFLLAQLRKDSLNA